MGLHEDQHLIIQDVLRVSREVLGGRIPKRDEYLASGGTFTRTDIERAFASWTTLLQASGLKYDQRKIETPDEKKYNRQIEKFGFKESILAKFDVEIKPYHDKFNRLNKDIFSVASITDAHTKYWCPFTWSVFLDYCKEAQPDLIVLGGDMLEYAIISRHNQNPQRLEQLQSEIDFVVENMLKAVRAVCPKAQIDYHLGNHEARLFTYLCTQSPALSSLRCLEFNKLLSLDELEINLIGRETFVFKTKMEDNFKVYKGRWAWTHGTDYGNFPAEKELGRHGVSGASGHVHRHTAKSKRDVFGFKTWMTLGASCTLKVGLEYMPSLINWETGFLLSFIHKNGVIQQHISTEGGYACVGGKFYTATA